MKKCLGYLIGGTLALAVIFAYPAYLLWGEAAYAYVPVAAFLCLLPTTVTLIWGCRSLQKPVLDQQLFLVLGGSGLRLAVVLLAGLGFYFLVPAFEQIAFWVCLLVFYLITLTLEMVLLTREQAAHQSWR